MNDDIEARIAAELRDLADGIGTSGPLAESARRRARTIRTRRRVAAAGVAVAVTAVAVPTVFALGGLGDPMYTPLPADTADIDEPTPAPTSTDDPDDPDESPTDVPDESPDPDEPTGETVVTVSLDDLPAGRAPGVDWIDGEVLRTADGREVPISNDMYDAAAFGDTVVGTYGLSYGEGTIVQAADGVTTRYSDSGPAMSDDDDLIAWYDQAADQIQITRADDLTTPSDVIPGEAGMRLQPVGFLDDETLVSNLVPAEAWPPAGSRRDTIGGEPDTPWPSLLEAHAVSAQAQLVVGLTDVQGNVEQCSDCDRGPGIERRRISVFSADSPEPLWSTWEYTFDDLSPDGRYLVGSYTYRDGLGDGFAAIVDASTGELVRRFDVAADPGGWLTDMVFEDDEQILLVMHVEDESGTRAAIVRCSIDGMCETATEVREPSGGRPYVRLDVRR